MTGIRSVILSSAGDTLSQIARRSGHSVHDLAGWNNLPNVNALEVGQVLRVQPPEGAASTTAVASSSAVQVRSIDEAKKNSRQKTTPQKTATQSSAAPAAAVANGNTKDVSGITWSWPTQGNVITPYKSGKNRGIDISGTKGQTVVAAADGTVLHRGNMNGYGNLVIIKHSDGVLVGICP